MVQIYRLNDGGGTEGPLRLWRYPWRFLTPDKFESVGDTSSPSRGGIFKPHS